MNASITAISESIPGIPPWLLREGISKAGISVGANTVAILWADILLVSAHAETLTEWIKIYLLQFEFNMKNNYLEKCSTRYFKVWKWATGKLLMASFKADVFSGTEGPSRISNKKVWTEVISLKWWSFTCSRAEHWMNFKSNYWDGKQAQK